MRALSIALLSVILGVLASRSVLSQQTATPLQIGYVDVERVLDEYKKRGTVVGEIDQRKEQLNQQFKTRRTQIEEKRERLATLGQDSDEFLRLEREVDLDTLAWKRDKDFEEQRLLREQNQKVGLIYREICNEVRVQAEQRGLASVFAYDPLPPGFETRMNALTVIQNRDVLWADSRLDITTPVIEALNAQLPAAPAGPK